MEVARPQRKSQGSEEFANEKFLMPVWTRSKEDVRAFFAAVLEFLDDNCTDKHQRRHGVT